MDYFQPVTALSMQERQRACEIYDAWVDKKGPAPGKLIKRQALLKFIGLLSIAGDRNMHLLTGPGLEIVQMVRNKSSDRIPYRNMILRELRRIPGVKACIDPAGPDHTRPDNLLRVIMVRDKLGGDSEFGSNFVASVVHMFPSDGAPQLVVYNLAFKQMPMSPRAREPEFTDKAAMQELKIMQGCSRLVERGVCPNLPMVYKHWICKDCTYWNPKLKKAPRRCLMMANELSTGGDLKSWMLKTRSQVAWKSCIVQILAGLVAFHNILGYMHDDMHHGNVLYDVVKPGGYWHYRFMTSKTRGMDIWVPNTGQLWKLWDFGLADKVSRPKSLETRQELACDAMRILGIVTHPEGREKPMPDRSISRCISDMVNKYEDTGICDEDGDVDEDALPEYEYTPAFEILMQLGWFREKPAAKDIVNDAPFQMPVY